jgi:hypothetical protein
MYVAKRGNMEPASERRKVCAAIADAALLMGKHVNSQKKWDVVQ